MNCKRRKPIKNWHNNHDYGFKRLILYDQTFYLELGHQEHLQAQIQAICGDLGSNICQQNYQQPQEAAFDHPTLHQLIPFSIFLDSYKKTEQTFCH